MYFGGSTGAEPYPWGGMTTRPRMTFEYAGRRVHAHVTPNGSPGTGDYEPPRRWMIQVDGVPGVRVGPLFYNDEDLNVAQIRIRHWLELDGVARQF
jgi:hypothetical protein